MSTIPQLIHNVIPFSLDATQANRVQGASVSLPTRKWGRARNRLAPTPVARRIDTNKPPAFQFYVKDWISSSTVRVMGWAAKGLFIELLALCWDNEGLPPEHSILQRMTGMHKQTWRSIWPEVASSFTEINGRLWNPKLLKLWLDLHRLSEVRSSAARQVEREGFVYAAVKPSAKIVKIGITNNLESRMGRLYKEIPEGEKEAECGLPNWEPVSLIGAKYGNCSLERQAHADLSTEHIGGEWFRATAKTLQWVRDHLSDNSNDFTVGMKQTQSKHEANDQQTTKQNEGLHLQFASASALKTKTPETAGAVAPSPIPRRFQGKSGTQLAIERVAAHMDFRKEERDRKKIQAQHERTVREQANAILKAANHS